MTGDLAGGWNSIGVHQLGDTVPMNAQDESCGPHTQHHVAVIGGLPCPESFPGDPRGGLLLSASHIAALLGPSYAGSMDTPTGCRVVPPRSRAQQ